VGRTAGDVALIDLERPPSDDRDVVHEIQVRMRASAGTNLSVLPRPTEKVDLKVETDVLPIIPAPFNSPLVAGEEMRTYVLRTTASLPAAYSRHVVIRPTDALGATFEIESVRVVTRREHLAGVSGGLGWHGLSEIYREALVARAPDALSFDVHLPVRPRLELAVGTIESRPSPSGSPPVLAGPSRRRCCWNERSRPRIAGRRRSSTSRAWPAAT
jgi:hypothetical protein